MFILEAVKDFLELALIFQKNNFTKQSVIKMISNLPKTSIKKCIDYALKNSLDGYAINEKRGKSRQ